MLLCKVLRLDQYSIPCLQAVLPGMELLLLFPVSVSLPGQRCQNHLPVTLSVHSIRA